jgi:protocadherin Fat 4
MDSDLDPVITYRIRDVCSHENEDSSCVALPDERSPFILDRESGDLNITQELDREEFAVYEITILAVDDCSSTGTATVVVTVLNINDNAPMVRKVGTNRILEEQAFTFYFLTVTDQDYGQSVSSRFTFELLDNTTGVPMETNLFEIQTNPPSLRAQPLDREVASGYLLILNVTDWGMPNISTIVEVPVIVEDINDHSPTFESIEDLYMIPENILQTRPIVFLIATDDDAVESGNGRITYHLPQTNASYPHQDMFSVDQLGRLTANTTLDREEQEHLFVLVEARDNPDNVNSEHRSDFVLVNITLTDLNDNIPLILTPPEVVSISESQRTNEIIFNVTASDNDTAPYSTLTYSMTPENGPFQINRTTGAVTLVSSLDYEMQTNYTLEVTASDVSETGRRMVTVLVVNENDERCVFDRDPYLSTVRENRDVTVRVVDINASDMDTPPSLLMYSIITGNERQHFRINAGSGEIFTTQALDHDAIRNYTLRVSCNDTSEFPTVAVVFIEVIDENDSPPVFVGTPYNFSVIENSHNGTVVNRIRADDADSTHNGAVRYIVRQVTPRGAEPWFMLNERTGEINTTRSLDREDPVLSGIENKQVILHVQAFDQPTNSDDRLFDTAFVYIEILDENDMDPDFGVGVDNITFHLRENYALGLDFPMPIRAVDSDASPHNIIEYAISGRTSQEDREMFQIHPSTGELSLTSTLDFETNMKHMFEVQAIDTDERNRQDTLWVIVIVENVAEDNVTFVNFITEINVVENSPIDHIVMSFTVTDMNETPLLVNLPTLDYFILNRNGTMPTDFSIRNDSANSRLIVYISGNIDRESQGATSNDEAVVRQFNITATDTNPSEQSHGSTSAILTVTIVDVNDNPPTFVQPSYTFSVVEEGTDLSVPIGQVTATDRDFGINGTQGITYHIPSSVPFEINADGEIRPTHVLDREEVERHEFSVIATDGGPEPTSSTVMVRVDIIDINDNEPQFDSSQSLTFRVGEQASVNTIVAVLRASDNDTGAFGRVNISAGEVVSPHFRLEPNGSIILIQSLDREASSGHFLTAVAMDGGGLRTTAEVDILVEDFNDNAPIFNRSVRTIKVPEDKQHGEPFALVTAEDADIGMNGMVNYVIGNYSLQSVFVINQTSGQISLRPQKSECMRFNSVIDFEKNSDYDVSIVAYDLGYPRHIANKVIKIIVRPVNEHPPLFDKNFLVAYTDETRQSGVEVMQIRAVDMDRNDNIRYEVLEVLENATEPSSLFRYDHSRNAIVNTGPLDYRMKGLYLLLITAVDNGNSMGEGGELTGNSQVLIGVRNINDHPPVFLEETRPAPAGQSMVVSESTLVSTVIWTVRATDEDNATHDAVSYYLEGGEGQFSIDSLTGEISVSASLDFEVRQRYNLQVIARDTGSPQMTSANPVTLIIDLKNENDQSPTFNSTQYTFHFLEKQPVGSVVGSVYAADLDNGSFGEVRYSIFGTSEHFNINEMNGEITSRILIDRDAIAAETGTAPVLFQFRVLATDGAPRTTARTTGANVTVVITDKNDNPPEFSSPQYLFRISPTHAVSEPLGTLTVSDRDEAENSRFQYDIVGEGNAGGVPLMISSGQARLERGIPPLYQPVYIYTVRAIDMGNASLQSSARLELIVETPNNHHPVFDPVASDSVVAVNEMLAVGETVFHLRDVVSDQDIGSNGRLSFQFAENYPKFQLNDDALVLREALDYEGTRSYNLTVLAIDGTPQTPRTATGTIMVTVEPSNEHTPVFMGVPSLLTLSHLPFEDLTLYTMRAEDEDMGTDGDIRYNIIDSSHLFTIGAETGVLKNRAQLLQDNSYNLTIGAYDLGNPFRSANMTVIVTIRNSADIGAPIFFGEKPRTIRQPETDSINGALNGELVTNPPANSYHIVLQTVSGQTTPIDMFSILPDVDRLTTMRPLDHEQVPEYKIIIESRVEITSASSIERKSDFLEVTFVVTDVNDNMPIFSPLEDQRFNESTPIGSFLFRVHAIDGDSGPEGEVTYDILRGDNEGTFNINSTSGKVFLSRSLDREVVSEYELEVRARDLNIRPQSSLMTVRVVVTDVNDFVTTYNGRNFSLGVYEFPHTVGGDRIVKLAAIDEDEGPPLTYTIELVDHHTATESADTSTLSRTFHIDPNTGLITVMQTLDRESVDQYLLRVTASDRQHTAETFLSITVLDVNDNVPIMTISADDVVIWEGQAVGSLVTDTVRVVDADLGVNSWFQFSLGEGWPEGDLFAIDPISGVVRINNPIVATQGNSRFFGTIIAEDQGPGNHRVSGNLLVSIIDVNDHPPLFESESIELSLSITADVLTEIHRFVVTDEDFTSNASPLIFSIPVYYSEANANFNIIPHNGSLRLRQEQREVRSYNFAIDVANFLPLPSCSDYDQASSINVTVNVRPINTHCPEFTESTYHVNVEEETQFSSSLGEVSSFDRNGDRVTYSLLNESNLPFTVNSWGEIRLKPAITLDREALDTYSLSVLATDNGFPPKSCSATVVVSVLDVNDHQPVFDAPSYTGSVMENLAMGSRVLQVHASDSDLGDAASIQYSLRQANIPFTIDRDLGHITTTQSLDYDTLPTGRYMFAVVASDSGEPHPLSSIVNVTIVVQDVNEHAPTFIETPTEPITVGADRVSGNKIFTAQASDLDRGSDLVYSFVEPAPSCYFSLDNQTGTVKLKVNPNSCSTCADDLLRRSAPDPDYFIIDTMLRVTDGENTDTESVSFMIHNSFCVSVPSSFTLPVEIIAATITVILAIVLVIVCIFVFACICRARKSSNVKINDTTQPMELRKRFGSGRSSAATPAPVCKQTSMNSLAHEHNTITAASGGSAASSTRQSYTEQNSYPSPSMISRKSQLSKPYRSTSDLDSNTLVTDMLSGDSQDAAPYPKAQIEKIYAKNADLLNHSDSNESMHMFGSEGGGESDGGDDMLFAKFNDLDDDDDSTTMHDDDRSYQDRSLATSRENLSVPPVMDDPYPFAHPPLWAPRIDDMADTINEMAMGTYKAEDRLRRGPGSGQHYMNDFDKSQEVGSMYGASTQESTRPLLRHAHPQSRIPTHHMLQGAPEFYPYEDAPADVHIHDPNMKYGQPMYPAHDIPGGHPMARHGGGASQEVPIPYSYHGRDFMHHPSMHHEMGVVDHSPSSSSTPTEGTLNTRAMTNEYDESDLMYSSDTSINTNTEDPPHIRDRYSQQNHSQGDTVPPHARGYGKQQGHSQGDVPPHMRGYSQQGHSQGGTGPPHMRGPFSQSGQRHPFH